MLITRSPKFYFTDNMSLYHFKDIFPGYRVQMWQFLTSFNSYRMIFYCLLCCSWHKKIIAICIIVSLFLMRVYFLLLLEDAPRCGFPHSYLGFINLWMLWSLTFNNLGKIWLFPVNDICICPLKLSYVYAIYFDLALPFSFPLTLPST